MGVGFITGRMNYNKTDRILELCFEEAQNNDNKPIFLLVPEKYTYEIEKKLSEKFEDYSDPFFRIRVVSFSTLSKMVFTNTGGLKKRKISKSAKSMIIYKAIDLASKDLKTFKSDGVNIGLVKKIKLMITEFKQNNMSVEEVFEMSKTIDDDSLRFKLEDMALVYSKYEGLMEDKYLDTEDETSLFARQLEEFEDIKGSTVFMDEYNGFTQVQYLVLEKIISLAKNVYISLTTDLKNFNNPSGVFCTSNITFLKVNEICKKLGVERLKDENLFGCTHYDNEELIHLEQNINEYNPKVFELKEDEDNNKCGNVEILEFGNSHSEVEYISNEIARLIRDERYRYNEITVCMRNLDSYSYLIKGIFRKNNIRFFLDEKISASNNPILILILSILDMKKDNYSYSSVFRYLKSGLTGIDNTDISLLENYVIANGIKGKRWFEENWEYPISHSVEGDNFDEGYLIKINSIKLNVMKPIKELHDKLKGRNTVAEICRYLYEFTLEIELPERINTLIEEFNDENDLYRAKEYSQVWNTFVSMLDELVEFMGNEKIGIEKFIYLMESELGEIELGIIPPERDQVFVTSIDRMKNPNTKVIFILGANDGVLPQNIGENSMLTDFEKDKLLKRGVKFDSNIQNRIFEEQYLLYKAMSVSMSKIIISYPLADFEGKALRPTPIIKRIEKMFPYLKKKLLSLDKDIDLEKLFKESITVEMLFDNLLKYVKLKKETGEESILWEGIYRRFKNDELYSRKIMNVEEALGYRNNSFTLDKEKADSLYGAGNFSVSKLERYTSCPFSFFMMYGLKAKPREEYSFNPMDAGSYAHKILDEFSRGVSANGMEWSNIDDNYVESEIERISKSIVSDKMGYILNSSPQHIYLTKRINKRLEKSIKVMVDQVNSGDFIPTGFEVGFGFDAVEGNSEGNISNSIPAIEYKLEDGKNIRLRGNIDRVDVYDNGQERYLSIVDYKSSTRKIDLNKVYAGLQLQLFVYMNAVLNSSDKFKMKPAALLYSKFNGSLSKVDNHKGLIEKSNEDNKKEYMSNNMFEGFIIKDLDLISHLDKKVAPKEKSMVYPFKIAAKGDFDSRSTRGLYEEEYFAVDKYVIDKTKDICESIYSGNIDVKPFKYGSSKPCDYCDFNSVCQFDTSIKGNKYNIVEKVDMLDLIKIKEDTGKEEK